MTEIEYIPIKSDGGTIVHFTNSIDNLILILEFGFLYTVNPTKIWEKLFRDIGFANVPDIENGMVCFSEVPEGADRVAGHFGDYGIAVDFNWALDNGLKQVAYIPDTGPVYESLKTLLRASRADLPDYGKLAGDERTGSVIQESILNNPHMPASFTGALYALIAEMLQWVETDANKEEHEWRMRSLKKMGGMIGCSKTERVNLAKAMQDISNDLLVLPNKSILYLKCPKEHQEEFKERLNEKGLGNLKMIFY